MSGGLSIMGRDIRTHFGAHVAPHQGHEASPEFQDARVTGAGMIGSVPGLLRATLPDKTRSIRIEIEAADPATLRTRFDAFKALVFSGMLDLVFDDRPTWRHEGRCTLFEPVFFGPAQGAFSCQVNAAFSLHPIAFATTPQTIALVTGVRTRLPMGTAFSELTIMVHGGGAGITDFDVLLRDKAESIIFKMEFTGALTSVERAVIESAISRITKVNGTTGAVSDAYALWDRTVTTEANDFPVLRPQDADYETAAWPTMELVAGSAGTPVGSVEYTPSYL